MPGEWLIVQLGCIASLQVHTACGITKSSLNLHVGHWLCLDVRVQVIASDGLWDVLSADEAVAHVMDSLACGKNAAGEERAYISRKSHPHSALLAIHTVVVDAT